MKHHFVIFIVELQRVFIGICETTNVQNITLPKKKSPY